MWRGQLRVYTDPAVNLFIVFEQAICQRSGAVIQGL